ncbi:MAG TPA: MBL fold metallo-hydrolase [Vicinamibacterales bacterium]|jgi:glyoxylase-like metal-dependent hydrolase (beta-lactamase superfamily II)
MNARMQSVLGAVILAAVAVAAPAAAQGQQDFSQVKIVTTRVGSNLWALDGQGGRMGVLAGPDGVFIVDSQFAPLSEKLLAAIKQVAPSAPLRFLVNTHVHGDHTGGNENFAKAGVTLMSRPMLRQRLAKPSAPAAGGATPAPAPPAALAVITFDSRTTVYMNGEAIELIPLPNAHTDGDTAVKFPAADVLMTGDVFRSAGFPNIDRANGGTLKGILEGLSTLIEAAGPNTKVLPGHGDITNRAGLVAHRDMALTLRDRVQKAIASGQNQQQIIAAKLTKDFDEKTGNVAGSADRFIGQLYAELGGK